MANPRSLDFLDFKIREFVTFGPLQMSGIRRPFCNLGHPNAAVYLCIVTWEKMAFSNQKWQLSLTSDVKHISFPEKKGENVSIGNSSRTANENAAKIVANSQPSLLFHNLIVSSITPFFFAKCSKLNDFRFLSIQKCLQSCQSSRQWNI